MLVLDEATHTYRRGSVVVPSVTQFLSSMEKWGMVDRETLEHAQARGTAVHKICQFYDEGDLDDASVGNYRGYLNAWIKFIAEYKPTFHAIERSRFSPIFNFAGTPDREATLGHRVYNGDWVLDIKTATVKHRIWGMQVAAYRHLVSCEKPAWLTARRATVQLQNDGNFNFIPWDDKDDWPAFQALINLTRWSKK